MALPTNCVCGVFWNTPMPPRTTARALAIRDRAIIEVLYGSGLRRQEVCDLVLSSLDFENEFKPAETKAIAGNVKTMTADAVAQAILSGMAAGKYEIVPGFDGQMTVVASRFLPGVTRWVCDQSQKKAKV